MFVTPLMGLIGIALELFAGAIVGLATLALMPRSQLRLRTAIVGATVAGLVFVFAYGVGGWADSHAEFVHGKRVDFASWGEDLRLRNFLAENVFWLAIAVVR